MRRGGSTIARRLAGLCLTALVLTSCGSAPPKIGPSGVDGLTVPTPSPQAADFRIGVDNPWLPLAPGFRATYAATGGDRPDGRVTLTVAEDLRDVGDIRTTVVLRVESPEGLVARLVTESYYAQDVAGNVWLFGERTVQSRGGPGPPSWLAGTDGAQAALAMPAVPRLGDGFVTAYAPGLVDESARVLSVTDAEATAYDTYDPLVLLQVTSALDPSVRERRWYAQGFGLVRQAGADGRVVELVPA